MTGFGRDAFTDAERQAAMGWASTLLTPAGMSWLLNPGSPWMRWTGPTGWQPCPPPADPGLRAAARRVPAAGAPAQPPRTPGYQLPGAVPPSMFTGPGRQPAPVAQSRPAGPRPVQPAPPVAMPIQQAPMSAPAHLPFFEILPSGKSFVAVGDSALAFIDRAVRVVKWTTDLRGDPTRENKPNPVVFLIGHRNCGELRFA